MAQLQDPVARAAAARPDDNALVFEGRSITYLQLHRAVEGLARLLVEWGLGPGDRLALLLDNEPLYVALVHAAARAGVVLVPLNTRLAPVELEAQIDDAKPSVLVYGERYAALSQSTGCKQLVSAERAAAASAPRMGRQPEQDLDGDRTVDRWPDVGAHSSAAIVYTSGTTGRPKGAVLTHGNLRWSASASAMRLGHRPGDRWLLPLPLYHVGGLATLHKCALYGSAVEIHARFEETAVAVSLQENHISHVSMVPTMLHRVLDAWGPVPVPISLRVVLVGGDALRSNLAERALDLGLPVFATYGLTEACSQVATSPVAGPLTDPIGAGRPLVGVRVRIVRKDGSVCGPGEVGEIQVAGPTVMAGYWESRTGAPRPLADGWLPTGDSGRFAASGDLIVAGRRRDLIVTGGENVHPSEVETVLDAHPGVAASCVVGLDDDEWGAEVVAAVVPTGAPLDERVLRDHCRERLAGYKVPRRVLSLTELPRTGSGKVERVAVRQRIEELLGRRQG